MDPNSEKIPALLKPKALPKDLQSSSEIGNLLLESLRKLESEFGEREKHLMTVAENCSSAMERYCFEINGRLDTLMLQHFELTHRYEQLCRAISDRDVQKILAQKNE